MKPTPLEELREKIWKRTQCGEDGHLVSYSNVEDEIDAAIAAEKRRVCANFKHAMRGDFQWQHQPSYNSGTRYLLPSEDGSVLIGGLDCLGCSSHLDFDGYCHKFTPRESEVKDAQKSRR